MNRHFYLFTLCSLFALSIAAQRPTDVSFQLQVYPTGIIPGISAEKSISDKGRIGARIGANLFDHRDLGEQDDEIGWGVGFSIDYQHYFKQNFEGWHLEFKNDFWFSNVDWTNFPENGDIVEGETDITVIQPTVSLGYTILSNSNLVIRPTIGFGLEWNVRTDGEPTGEGPIGLIGISIGKRF